MRIINGLTVPGGIRRVDLTPSVVRIQTSDGQERLYRLSTEMSIVCSWCGKSMGKKDGNGQSGVTHSICPDCAAKELNAIGEG